LSTVSDTPYRDLAVKAATFATRVTVAVGIPTLLFLKLDSLPTLSSPPGKLAAASLVILSGPSTLYCALGALEGFVRACGYCFKAVRGNSAELNWDLCAKERTTIHGLVRGALSPLGGYNIIIEEWNLQRSNKDKGSPRVLKEEYYVYSIPRSIGHGIIEIGNWALRQFKWGLDLFVEKSVWITLKLWQGVCWAKDQIVSFIQWCWNVTQPVRQFALDITVAVLKWSAHRIVDVWNFTQPLRSFVKWIVWDNVVKKVIWNLILKTVVWEAFLTTVVWNLILKTIIWKCLLKTVIGDWVCSKFIGKFLCETVLLKGLWPYAIRPVITLISFVFTSAFSAIAWALQQAFRRGQ
jgi:hypothetical protein